MKPVAALAVSTIGLPTWMFAVAPVTVPDKAGVMLTTRARFTTYVKVLVTTSEALPPASKACTFTVFKPPTGVTDKV
jgi:hypothetical protein